MISKNKQKERSFGVSGKKIAALVVIVGMVAMAFFVMQARGDVSPPHSQIEVGDPHYTNTTGATYVNTTTTLRVWGESDDTSNPGWTVYYRIFAPSSGWGAWQSSHNKVAEFPFGEKCKHYVEYYAVDDRGRNESEPNWENVHNMTFYVDDTAPTTTIEFGEPEYNGYITSDTIVYINATDEPDGCASGVKYTEYRIWYDGDWGDWTIYTGPFSLRDIGDTNECEHRIQAQSADNLDNNGSVVAKTVYVDNTPPGATKTVGEPNIEIIPDKEYYVTSDTEIKIEVDNQGSCNVGSVHINITIEYQGQITYINDSSSSGTLTKNIPLPENCTHILSYRVYDDLGNMYPSDGWDTEIFHVDNIPPETAKERDGTFIHHYDPANESIYLDMDRNPLDSVSYEAFPLPNSINLLELYPTYGTEYYIEEWADNCDNVLSPDDTIVLRDVSSNTKATYHVEDVTITLYVSGPGDMYIEFLGGFANIQNGMADPNGTAWHQIRPTQGFSTKYTLDDWKDNDKDGKLSYGDNINLTDPSGVETKWTIGQDVKTDVIVTPEFWWEKYCSNITLTARDPGECAVDNVSTYWGYEDMDGNWYPKLGAVPPQQGDPGYEYNGNYNWTYFPQYGRWFYNYTRPIHFDEECVHILKYFSEDEFGNREKMKIQEYHVDATAPWVIQPTNEFWIDGPTYEDANGNISITNKTTINLIAEDSLGDCDIGSVIIHYRIHSCENKAWRYYNFISNKWEEGWGIKQVDAGRCTISLHLNDTECKHYLEWWTEDDLGNRNPKDGVYNYTFYVDNTPPLENKTVGNPKLQLNENVWKINETTKIWLNSTDEGGCASGVNSIKYRVWANGGWDQWDDYSSPFFLTGEGNKTLQVNVTDNLGNSMIYDEPFYVDNTPPTSDLFVGNPHWPPTELSSGNISVDTPVLIHGEDAGSCKPLWRIRYNITDNENNEQVYPVGAPYAEGNWFEVINFTFGKLGLGAGNYTLKYWAFDGVNEQKDTPKEFKVVELPLAEIVYHPNATEKPSLTTADTISFGTKTNNPEDITDYMWDFGDGYIATGRDVTHRFSDPGIYEVKLKAMAFRGWLVGNDSVILSIVGAGPGPGNAPEANFSYTPSPPIYPTIYEDIPFDSSASSASKDTDPGDHIIWRYWDWGDGNITYNQTCTTHRYASGGTYVVTLYVYDSTYLYDSENKTITVLDDKNPVADFMYDPSTPIENEVVTFDASNSHDPDGSIINWTWDFGDGSVGYGETATHAYVAPNDYTVTLTVEDDKHAINTTSKVIRVYGKTTVPIPLVGKDGFAAGYGEGGDYLEGWNLITIPVQNTYTAKTLMEDISASGTTCVQLCKWNLTKEQFDSLFYDKVHDTYTPLGLEPDTPIEDGIGYFVYVETSTTFTVTGYPIFNAQVLLDTSDTDANSWTNGWSKWNLLGWFDLTDTTAQEFAKEITQNDDYDFNHSQVSIWNATEYGYDTYIPGVEITDFDIRAGMGMFVWVPNGDYWTHSQAP